MPETDLVETTTTAAAEMETAQQAGKATPETGAVSRAEFEAVQKALKEANKEAAARRKALEAYEADKKAREEAEMTDLQKAQKRLAELEGALKATELKDRKRAIADKVGLPAVLASRLQGETEEELEVDAKALLETLPKPAKASPGVVTNPGSGATAETTDEQFKAAIFGRGVNIWDIAKNSDKGGGIFITEK